MHVLRVSPVSHHTTHTRTADVGRLARARPTICRPSRCTEAIEEAVIEHDAGSGWRCWPASHLCRFRPTKLSHSSPTMLHIREFARRGLLIAHGATMTSALPTCMKKANADRPCACMYDPQRMVSSLFFRRLCQFNKHHGQPSPRGILHHAHQLCTRAAGLVDTSFRKHACFE